MYKQTLYNTLFKMLKAEPTLERLAYVLELHDKIYSDKYQEAVDEILQWRLDNATDT